MTTPDDRLLALLTVAELRTLIREEAERAVQAALSARFGPPRPPRANPPARRQADPAVVAEILARRRRRAAKAAAKHRQGR